MIQLLNCGTSEDSTIWFCKDREGILTSSLTQILLLFSFLLSKILLFPTVIKTDDYLYLAQMMLVMIYLLCAYCHFACIFTNPGSVPHNAHPIHTQSIENGDLLMRCGICNAFKPNTSHHCRVCNRCIIKMDHHCPWINNCVGMMNMKFFFLFLIYTIVLCIIVLLFSFICFFRLLPTPYSTTKAISCLCTLLGIALPFFFIVFGIMIFIDTLKTVFSGQTSSVVGSSSIEIDRKKGTESDRPSNQLCLRDVFGGDGSFSILWLLPTKPVFEHSLGFDLDCSGKRWNGYQVCNCLLTNTPTIGI